MESCFINCTGFRGGAIYSESVILEVEKCIFAFNNASFGSSIYNYGAKETNISKSCFYLNECQNGGIIIDSILNSQCFHSFIQSNFSREFSKTSACFCIWGGFLHYLYNFIDHCSSSVGYGVVSLSLSKGIRSKMGVSSFSHCFGSRNGATINIVSSHYYNLDQCYFMNNTCKNTVGDNIYFQDKNIFCELNQCTLIGNISNFFGDSKIGILGIKLISSKTQQE